MTSRFFGSNTFFFFFFFPVAVTSQDYLCLMDGVWACGALLGMEGRNQMWLNDLCLWTCSFFCLFSPFLVWGGKNGGFGASRRELVLGLAYKCDGEISPVTSSVEAEIVNFLHAAVCDILWQLFLGYVCMCTHIRFHTEKNLNIEKHRICDNTWGCSMLWESFLTGGGFCPLRNTGSGWRQFWLS